MQSPEHIHGQVADLLRAMSRAWEAHDFAFLRAIWSLSPAPPVYLPEEEPGFKRSHEELEDYWQRTEAGIVEVRGDYRLEAVMPLGAGFHSVTFRNEWAAREQPGEAMIGGECRGYMVVEEYEGGIRPRAYVEAPLAPLIYMRELYALVARTRGL